MNVRYLQNSIAKTRVGGVPASNKLYCTSCEYIGAGTYTGF